MNEGYDDCHNRKTTRTFLCTQKAKNCETFLYTQKAKEMNPVYVRNTESSLEQ